MNVIEAMDDLFEPWFRGPSWNGWRAILKAAFALPMTAEEKAFFRTVAERDPPRRRVRELWLVIGRRAGKDSIASLIAAHSAALFDGQDRLRRGERALVLALACDREQAKIVTNYTRAYFTDIPPLARMLQRETLNGVELSNNVDVAIGTNDFRSVRGRPILCCVLDEVAFFASETSASPDIETYRAIQPGMATLPDSMLIGISSPYRKSGLLFDKYRKHFGRDDDDVLVVQAPSIALNPTLDQRIIDQALADDPAAAAAEWLGEFRDDLSDFITLAALDRCTPSGNVPLSPAMIRNMNPVAATDVAGGSGTDSFATAVAYWDPTKEVAVLAALKETPGPCSPELAIADHAAFLREYGVTTVVGDRYAGNWPLERWRKHDIRYEFSPRNRSEIYLNFLPMLNSAGCVLLSDARMRSQFLRLERRTTRSGRDQVDHPTGKNNHDDVAQVAAASLLLASESARPTWLVTSVATGFGGAEESEHWAMMRRAMCGPGAVDPARKPTYESDDRPTVRYERPGIVIDDNSDDLGRIG